MVTARFDLNREILTDLLTAVMAGRSPEGLARVPLHGTTGLLKTYAMEVHVDPETSSEEQARHVATRFGLNAGETLDPTLGVMWDDSVSLFVDSLDARFWLIHTSSPARRVQSLLGRAVWGSRELDWCWFPTEIVGSMAAEGQLKWFKSDFRGDDLLPTEGIAARRMRVQLEGDDPADLLDQLVQNPKYRRATALSALALEVSNDTSEAVQEYAQYRGRFVTRGDSFEAHVGFVARTIQQYATLVNEIEERYPIRWNASPNVGAIFTGDVVQIELDQPIASLEKFVDGLFSCRDPFRLWAVPRWIGDRWIEAEAVDLHVGTQIRMDIAPNYMRMYLPENACGNTVVRLVANLQHRYDATVRSPVAIRSRSTPPVTH